MGHEWTVHNPEGKRRVVVTKELPGTRWLDILVAADCAVEVCESPHTTVMPGKVAPVSGTITCTMP